jgi:hypothetical protein
MGKYTYQKWIEYQPYRSTVVMNTKYYNKLYIQKNHLQSLFLPIKNRTSYSVEEKEKARCFFILMHAEVESYFESIIKHTINVSLFRWRYRRNIDSILLSLISSKQVKLNTAVIDVINSFLADSKPLEDKILDFGLGELQDSINKCYTKILDEIDENNGIKEKNLKLLLEPIGYDISSKFPNLVSQTNAYGGNRGYFAHNSSTLIRIDRIDPFSILTTTNTLLSEIKLFDIDLVTLW